MFPLAQQPYDVCRTATHVYVIGAMNLLASIPPKVSSPFWDVSDVGGANARATRSAGMMPFPNRLSVTTKNVGSVALSRRMVCQRGRTREDLGPANHWVHTAWPESAPETELSIVR